MGSELTGAQLVGSLEQEQKEVVERIFTFYCSFGDPMNSAWLKSSKFIKFLRDCGLLKQGVLQNHDLKKENRPNRRSTAAK
jgi:hypothetical protein